MSEIDEGSAMPGSELEDYIYRDPTSSSAPELSVEERNWIDGLDEVYQTSQKISEALTFLPSVGGGDGPENFDYCMVIPTTTAEDGVEVFYNGEVFYVSKLGHSTMTTLVKAGLHCLLIPEQEEKSKSKKQNNKETSCVSITEVIAETAVCFLLIRASSIDVLREHALNISDNSFSSSSNKSKRGMRMLCDMQTLAVYANKNDLKINDGFDVNGDKFCPSYTPYESIYAEYTDVVPENLYWRPNDLSHPFRSSVRLALLLNIIEQAIQKDEGIPAIRVEDLLKLEEIKAFYPLHNSHINNKLLRHWTALNSTLPWNLPFFQIKEYFGETIALFICLEAHYTTWLIIPAIIGVPLQVVIIINDWDYSSKLLPAYAFCVCIWAIAMLEFWKQRESVIALSWGTTDFKENEETRIEYQGEIIDSYVEDKKMLYYPPKQARWLAFQSALATTAAILVLLMIVVAIYVERYNLEEDPKVGGSKAQIFASALNAIVITITNPLYFNFAKMLTEYENHRTDSDFYNGMVSKIFVFQFINSYASFFYLAFIAAYVTQPAGTPSNYLGDCGFSNCMKPLSINMLFIFVGRVLTYSLFSFVIPYLKYQFRTKSSITFQPQKEYLLEKFDTHDRILIETCDLVIQFGFVTMFISALPAATTIVFFNNLFEMKGDVWSLLTLYRRPIPIPADNIGVWQHIFTIISIAAVITNGGITVLTMNVLNSYRSSSGGFWFFTCFQWFGFLLQVIAILYIDDCHPDVLIQLKRRDYIQNRLFKADGWKMVSSDNTSKIANKKKKARPSRFEADPRQERRGEYDEI